MMTSCIGNSCQLGIMVLLTCATGCKPGGESDSLAASSRTRGQAPQVSQVENTACADTSNRNITWNGATGVIQANPLGALKVAVDSRSGLAVGDAAGEFLGALTPYTGLAVRQGKVVKGQLVIEKRGNTGMLLFRNAGWEDIPVGPVVVSGQSESVVAISLTESKLCLVRYLDKSQPGKFLAEGAPFLILSAANGQGTGQGTQQNPQQNPGQMGGQQQSPALDTSLETVRTSGAFSFEFTARKARTYLASETIELKGKILDRPQHISHVQVMAAGREVGRADVNSPSGDFTLRFKLDAGEYSEVKIQAYRGVGMQKMNEATLPLHVK